MKRRNNRVLIHHININSTTVVLILVGDESTWERKANARRREFLKGPLSWRLR
jgi:hypothetical protein